MASPSHSAVTIALLGLSACADPSAPPRVPNYQSVSAGPTQTCAVATDGAAYCWGRNLYGGLGDGTNEPSAVPVRVTVAGWRFDSITTGWDFACALDRRGVAYCWGANQVGQLGDGSTAPRSTPRPVAGDLLFERISAGEAHVCGVSVNGTTYCWGAALTPAPGGGAPTVTIRPAPQPGPSFEVVSVGTEIACGITPGAGNAYCWGLQPPGVIPDNGLAYAPFPEPVEASPSLASVSAGWKHACGVTANGTAYCWGLNAAGQLGDGSDSTRVAPRAVQSTATFATVSARAVYHSCGVTTTGAGWCWGANGSGQLGTGDHVASTTPLPVAGSLRFMTIEVGFYHSCGITIEGALYCWGAGGMGQLGTGGAIDADRPVSVTLPR